MVRLRVRLRASTFRRRVPATSLGFGFSPPGRVPFGTGRKEPKARSLCRGCRQALQIAGSRTGGRGTFSCARESTQRVRIGGEPPMYPPLSCTASLSFRRPGPAAALLPPTASGLLHPYASAIPPHRGAWSGEALRRGAPLGVQARRLEHRHQAPVGGAEDYRAKWQKAGGRRG